MSGPRNVIIKQLPENLTLRYAHNFFTEVQPFLKADKPCLVFDFSDVHHLDSAGVEMLLRCMEEAMKRNGDVKLAAVSPSVAVILELTRVDRLFEIFENAADAVESFYRFPVHAFQRTDAVPGSRPTNGDADAA